MTTAARGSAVDWFGEIALVSVTVVLAVGMRRVFEDDTFLRDVLIMGLLSHLVAATARRAGLGLALAALLSTCCFFLTATALWYADTAWFILPTETTLQVAQEQLEDAWQAAVNTSAPVETLPGLVLVAGAALWVNALYADDTAFRDRAHALALVPGALLFVFLAMVGVEEGQVTFATWYCVAAAALLVALRLRDRYQDRWIESRPGQGLRKLRRASLAAAAVAVIAGASLGPMLPGNDAVPWVDLTNLDVTNNSRVVISPLVQTKSRLVQLSQQELFTVAAPRESPQYWRLMSLDEFDGDVWRTRSQFTDVSGPLRSDLDTAEGTPLRHTVSLTSLASAYLPAAYEPRQVIDDGGVRMAYESSSSTLITARDSPAGPIRFRYTVQSLLPRIDDPNLLRAADTAMLESGFLAFNTSLADDVVELVQAEARRVTADADSDYQRARDLQDYFWSSGIFSYDAQIAAGHGVDSLEDFLFDVRAGYCEQFASAYAAMARSIGLPARVAVGFTWGEWDQARGVYSVRGEHAHAWPEVFFADVGWVRFEPTPGRGAPDDFAVTGRVADQAGSAPTTTVAVPEPDQPDDGGGLALSGNNEAGQVPQNANTAAAADTESDAATLSESANSGPWIVALVIGVIGLALAAVPGLRSLVRQKRHSRLADDPAGGIEAAWDDVLEALALINVRAEPDETPLELAQRVRSERRMVGPVDVMARLATHGRYARITTPALAGQAEHCAATIVTACHQQASRRRLLLATFNPATIFRRQSPLHQP